jgi:hypothetical protein
MTNIFIMALEPLDTRYTGQWYNGLPRLIQQTAQERGVQVCVHNIAGEQTSTEVTEGAFLDFFATNIWKNSQVNKLVEFFQAGLVKPGDKVLFTDAWHTGITQVRYMSELMGIPVEIHSMWHAGSYDPQDFLGRLIKDKSWTYNTERGLFYASHFNYFATEFHRDLFFNVLFGHLSPLDREAELKRCVISGQPHNALVDALREFEGMPKRDLVLFPHRIAPEKQVDIFRDLAEQLPDIEFVVCQDTKLSKDEYHKLLGEAKVVFSANLQETLGISAMEGTLVGAIPFLPNRLSYSEMYHSDLLYPSEWSIDWDCYVAHRYPMVKALRHLVVNHTLYQDIMGLQKQKLLDQYLTCTPMLDKLING